MQSRVFDVQGKQESRGEQANTAGKAHTKPVVLELFPVLLVPSGNTTLAQSILPWDSAACSQKAQVSSSLSCVQISCREARAACTFCPPCTRTFPSPGWGRRALPGRDTPKGQDRTTALCLPPVSCRLCIAFVSLFVTKLESWLQGPWLCWGKAHRTPALVLLQGLQGCA